jgi:hypothetical protein
MHLLGYYNQAEAESHESETARVDYIGYLPVFIITGNVSLPD